MAAIDSGPQRYLWTCPCGQSLTIEKTQAGQQTPCHCGQLVELPTLRQISQLPLVPTEQASRRRSEGGWPVWVGLPMAALIVLGLFWGVMTGLRLFESNRLYKSYGSFTVDQAMEDTERMIESLSPSDLLENLRAMRDDGLGPRDPPDFHRMNVIREQLHQQIRFYGSLAGGSLLGAALLALVPRWLGVQRRRST